jgi:effector-binding domain-containing protein
MDHACELIERKAEAVLFVRTRTSVDRLPQVMGRVHGEMMVHLDKVRAYPSGPPSAAYYDLGTQEPDLEIRVPVASLREGPGDIRPGEIPSGCMASCVHTVPSDRLAAAYRALAAWMEAQGIEPSGIAYELYLNDPASMPRGSCERRLSS